MRSGGKRAAARTPEQQPADDRDDCDDRPQRRERNQRLLGGRQRDRGLLAVELLGRAGASLKLALDLRLPGPELGVRGKQGDQGRRTEQIGPKPG